MNSSTADPDILLTSLATAVSPTLDSESACELCVAQVVTFPDPATNNGQTCAYTLEAKYRVFHEPCELCDNEEIACKLQLCEPCRHLRLRHLLCLASKRGLIYDTKIPLLPRGKSSDLCDLCRFLDAASVNRMEDPGLPDDGGRLEHRLENIGHGHFTIYTKLRPWCTSTHVLIDGVRKEKQVVSKYIDWDLMRNLLLELPDPHISRYPYAEFSLPQDLNNLRVIDALSYCVIPMPSGFQYLALSYVWGPDSEDQIHCSRSNVLTLSQAGALRKYNLPQTISDAIVTCQKLGHRFLWVDRLCIVQDDSAESLSNQLNQMADIYHCAALTLVAATGKSATHGLAGISYPRDAQQVVCEYGKNFRPVTFAPPFESLIHTRKWWTRGWTYQEYVASHKLLFFTDGGLYFRNSEYPQTIKAEGPIQGSSFMGQELGLSMIHTYTQKDLTYDTDILNACSGLLRALYGDRSMYGMPWDEFDRAILWRQDAFDCGLRKATCPEVFPTWSWISCLGSVTTQRNTRPLYSLAYWGRLDTDTVTAPGPLRWYTLEPAYTYKRDKSTWDQSKFSHAYISAGLAWLHGYIQAEAPSWLHVDCTSNEYTARLEEKWSITPSLFWNSAFRCHGRVFEKLDRASLSKDGSLMVFTQKTSFLLDWNDQYQPPLEFSKLGFRPVMIRTDNHTIEGTCELSEYSVRRLRYSDPARATFIALSTGCYEENRDMIHYISKYFPKLPISAFYGCPCSTKEVTVNDLQHVEECPNHVDFHSIDPIWTRDYWDSRGPTELHEAHDLAYAHHLAKLSYFDINSSLLHEETDPPFLNVMLIAPSGDDGLQSSVYERIGIGRIYLKRWVEASPAFEALVLV